jgi:hypothetical protein
MRIDQFFFSFFIKSDFNLYQYDLMTRPSVANIPTMAEINMPPVLGSRYA